MDSSTLHLIHRISVSLFVLIYFVKMIAVFVNKGQAIRNIKWLKILEMIVATLFLITGLWMIFSLPQWSTQFILKLILVVISIPAAVMALKKNSKVFAGVALLCLFGAYGLAEVHKKKIRQGGEIIIPEASVNDTSVNHEEVISVGKAVYQAKCVICHGEDGSKGGSGAANLTESELSKEDAKTIISEGKKQMPAYGLIIKDEQVEAVAEYIQQFKK